MDPDPYLWLMDQVTCGSGEVSSVLISVLAHFCRNRILIRVRIEIWIRIRRISMFLSLLDQDPLVRGMDPDLDLAPDPDPCIIKQSSKQCCGTVTIYYGSGSDFWKVMVPVPRVKKLRFLRFRFHNTRKKNLDPTVLWILFDFLYLKNDVNVTSKSTEQKNLKKYWFWYGSGSSPPNYEDTKTSAIPIFFNCNNTVTHLDARFFWCFRASVFVTLIELRALLL